MSIHEAQSEILTDTGILSFPDDFRWGAATAAYQIEGAATTDGRGPSIWDTFSHTPGNVLGGDTGDVAVDHYHRYRDDVALMTQLGLRAYRFSVSWPRVQPGGRGPANQAGLDFYRRLVDCLLDADIEPWLTLYHWDLPQELEDAGGWPVRDTAERFAEYAGIVAEALGDRVTRWTTLNEPWCSAFLAYASGDHAPGRRDPASAVRAAHHLLLGHGLAAQTIRTAAPAASVGITLNLYAVSPATDAPEDLDGARRVDGIQNRLFLDAVLRGRYPEDVLADVAPLVGTEHIQDGDLATIAAPLDMLGVNYYSRHVVSGLPDPTGGPDGQPVRSPWPAGDHLRFVQRGRPVTRMGWEIDGDGLVEVLERVHREYPAVPLYITENGAAFDDVLEQDGTVDDPLRIGFLDEHLRACHQAIARGVDLRGYFAWSLLDNFEWAWGYSRRFGLVYVDYPTQRRHPKASARWYSEVIALNGLPPSG